jgi:predicted aminopeptidase
VLRARTPIERALQDPTTSPDERERLALVLEAREYARSLGLEVGQQYTSYAPWPGDRLVTAVVATRPGELDPATFWFPLVGDVPYKSYFKLDLAEREAEHLRARGLDVCLSPVPAYSTLGWLADPVTGPLLRAPQPDLVATVIHELVHATVYVPSDADFNEGLATFVGEEGALRFFAARDGATSSAADDARARIADERAIAGVLSALRVDVAALYAAEPAGAERDQHRMELVDAARARVAALPLATIDAQALADQLRTNDACLALEGTYTADLPQYEAALADLHGDLRALVAEARRAADTPDPRATLLAR